MSRKLTFSIRLLTPAFAGGAEPRQIDPHMPVRPSAVRGALRSWFRAAAAAVLFPERRTAADAERMIDALRVVENAVFGDTERMSPFAVLPPVLPPDPIAERKIPDPNERPGLRYLGYGIFDNLSPGSSIKAIKPDQTITLVLSLRREARGLAELLSATVWLWTHAGGLGARSRRGFGSMCLLETDSPHVPVERLAPPQSVQELIDNRLIAGLDWVVQVFQRHLPRFTSHPLMAPGADPHPALRTIDGIRSVTVLPVELSDGVEALELAGRLFRDYRSTLQRNKLGMPPLPDYFAVKNSLQSRTPPRSVDRAAFGLPLSFYFRSLGGRRTTFGPHQGGRLPSPLLFRVHALGEPDDQRRVVTLFNLAQGQGAQVLLGCTIAQSGEAWKVPLPDGTVVDQAISWMSDQAKRTPQGRPGGRR